MALYSCLTLCSASLPCYEMIHKVPFIIHFQETEGLERICPDTEAHTLCLGTPKEPNGSASQNNLLDLPARPLNQEKPPQKELLQSAKETCSMHHVERAA